MKPIFYIFFVAAVVSVLAPAARAQTTLFGNHAGTSAHGGNPNPKSVNSEELQDPLIQKFETLQKLHADAIGAALKRQNKLDTDKFDVLVARAEKAGDFDAAKALLDVAKGFSTDSSNAEVEFGDIKTGVRTSLLTAARSILTLRAKAIQQANARTLKDFVPDYQIILHDAITAKNYELAKEIKEALAGQPPDSGICYPDSFIGVFMNGSEWLDIRREINKEEIRLRLNSGGYWKVERIGRTTIRIPGLFQNWELQLSPDGKTLTEKNETPGKKWKRAKTIKRNPPFGTRITKVDFRYPDSFLGVFGAKDQTFKVYKNERDPTHITTIFDWADGKTYNVAQIGRDTIRVLGLFQNWDLQLSPDGKTFTEKNETPGKQWKRISPVPPTINYRETTSEATIETEKTNSQQTLAQEFQELQKLHTYAVSEALKGQNKQDTLRFETLIKRAENVGEFDTAKKLLSVSTQFADNWANDEINIEFEKTKTGPSISLLYSAKSILEQRKKVVRHVNVNVLRNFESRYKALQQKATTVRNYDLAKEIKEFLDSYRPTAVSRYPNAFLGVFMNGHEVIEIFQETNSQDIRLKLNSSGRWKVERIGRNTIRIPGLFKNWELQLSSDGKIFTEKNETPGKQWKRIKKR